MADPLSPTPAAVAPTAPVAPRRATVLEAHGDRRVDEWYWLRDRDDPAVVAHLRAENAYTEAATAHLAPLRDRLFEEVRARIAETDLSVPVRKGPWWYYSRTVEGLAYPIHCRRPVGASGADDPPDVAAGAADPAEQVLLDENALAEGAAYLALGAFALSPDHRLLAYATDTTGDERFTLAVRDLEAGRDLPGAVERTSYSVAWTADGSTLFYTRPDDANRPFQVWRHAVGGDPSGDVLVLQEDDERFFVGVGTTKDEAFVLIELQSQVTSEVHALPADQPQGRWRVIEGRRQGVEYGVEHHRGTFLVLTNDGAENFRLMAAPVASPGRRQWREVIAHRPGVRLLGLDVFDRHLVTYERVDGDTRITTRALGPEPWAGPLAPGRLLEGPESPATFYGGANPEFDGHVLRYEYTSLVTPRSVYDLDLDGGPDAEPVLRKRQPVLGGYDPDDYATARLWARSADGTAVPVSVVHRRRTPLDGTAPALVYGYGAYEHSVDPGFSSLRLSLLDRGVVFAIAHVRGGGELGRRWYEDGKLLAKPHTFEDFDAVVGHLADGLVDPRRVAARGGSAGGLLMGAAVNRIPDRLRAVVAEVPFVDCLTTISDETLPLTVIEWEEWGNPVADPEVYRVMRSYSPYDNVGPGPHPAVLATGGLEDPRVGYWEPAKWVQRLRAADPTARVLLKTELEAGHGGPSGRYDAWRDEAFVMAFVLDELGLADELGAGAG